MKSLVIWLALNGAFYPQIAPFFVLNGIFSPDNEVALLFVGKKQSTYIPIRPVLYICEIKAHAYDRAIDNKVLWRSTEKR